MRNLLRFLRPMAFARRKAIYAGLLGGNKRWLTIGGAAWVAHWIGRIFGAGEPLPKYTQEIGAGERVVVLHEPLSPLAVKKAGKKAQKQARKQAKQARRG